MGTTEKVAQFVVETGLDQIPKTLIDIAKDNILTEGLATALAGSQDPLSKIFADFVMGQGGESQAGVIGKGFRTSVPSAAFVNGAFSHIVDYDGATGSMHIGLLTASLLALGEKTGASGVELLEAYIIGMEVAERIGRVLGGPPGASYQRGWHPTAIIGPVAAGVGCTKLLKLDLMQARMALGVAVSQSSGVRQAFGTMTKPFHAGNAARSGVVAAMLAKEGLTHDPNILEAPFGFFNVLGEKGYDLEPVTKGLGNTFVAAEGTHFKRYPCCYNTHTAIETTLNLTKKYNISPEEVETIQVSTHYVEPGILIHNDPKTELEGKFSMQFCVAIALLDRKVGIGQFTTEKVLDPRTQTLMKKVAKRVDEDMKSTQGITMTIKLKDGRQYSERNEIPPGSPSKPLAREDLREKFRDCAEPVLSTESIESSIEMVEHLEDVKNVKELADCVTSPKK